MPKSLRNISIFPSLSTLLQLNVSVAVRIGVSNQESLSVKETMMRFRLRLCGCPRTNKDTNDTLRLSRSSYHSLERVKTDMTRQELARKDSARAAGGIFVFFMVPSCGCWARRRGCDDSTLLLWCKKRIRALFTPLTLAALLRRRL